jgi:HEAT repeat protein
MLKNLPNWLQRLAPQSGAGLKLSPQQRQELLAALASQRAADRWLAAEALAEGDPGREGVAALAGLLSDPDPLLRFEAARGLGQIGGKAARQALLAAAGSEDARVQAAAADGLGSLPASAESVAALAGLLESRDAAVRQSAGEALARLDPLPPARDGSSAAPAIQAALLRLLAEDDAMLVRRAAALALTRWGEGGGGGDTTADEERNTTADENSG